MNKNHELRIKQNEFDESRFDTVRPIRRTNKFSEVNSILVSWMRHIVKHWKIISQNTRKESNKRSVTNLWLHLCGINYHASKIIWHDWCDAMMSLNLRLGWKYIRLKCIKNQSGDVIRLSASYFSSWYVFWWFWSLPSLCFRFYIDERRNWFK